MICQDAKELVHAYVDDELDIVSSRQVEAHLHTCPACTAEFDSARAVKTAFKNPALYHRAPAGVIGNITAILPSSSAASTQPRRAPRWQRPIAWAASVLLVLATGSSLLLWQHAAHLAADAQADAFLAAHLRSMQLPDHLMDVRSTDQHTVKPWIDARLDFAPPVPQLAGAGYPLIGGRLDYVNGHPVAALVYNRGKHVINVFIHPGEDPSGASTSSRNGFNLCHWTDNGMTYWAVSDMNLPELEKFEATFRSPPVASPATGS
jgi:anti-sigma factor RsiW